jgi:predicted RNA-binding Zn-ribbon protein involved in translation (DUF1610 family)
VSKTFKEMVGMVCGKCGDTMLVSRKDEIRKHIDDGAKCSSCGQAHWWRPLTIFEQVLSKLGTVEYERDKGSSEGYSRLRWPD